MPEPEKQKSKAGGKRPGAGRKPKPRQPAARPIDPLLTDAQNWYAVIDTMEPDALQLIHDTITNDQVHIKYRLSAAMWAADKRIPTVSANADLNKPARKFSKDELKAMSEADLLREMERLRDES